MSRSSYVIVLSLLAGALCTAPRGNNLEIYAPVIEDAIQLINVFQDEITAVYVANIRDLRDNIDILNLRARAYVSFCESDWPATDLSVHSQMQAHAYTAVWSMPSTKVICQDSDFRGLYERGRLISMKYMDMHLRQLPLIEDRYNSVSQSQAINSKLTEPGSAYIPPIYIVDRVNSLIDGNRNCDLDSLLVLANSSLNLLTGGFEKNASTGGGSAGDDYKRIAGIYSLHEQAYKRLARIIDPDYSDVAFAHSLVEWNLFIDVIRWVLRSTGLSGITEDTFGTVGEINELMPLSSYASYYHRGNVVVLVKMPVIKRSAFYLANYTILPFSVGEASDDKFYAARDWRSSCGVYARKVSFDNGSVAKLFAVDTEQCAPRSNGFTLCKIYDEIGRSMPIIDRRDSQVPMGLVEFTVADYTAVKLDVDAYVIYTAGARKAEIRCRYTLDGIVQFHADSFNISAPYLYQPFCPPLHGEPGDYDEYETPSVICRLYVASSAHSSVYNLIADFPQTLPDVTCQRRRVLHLPMSIYVHDAFAQKYIISRVTLERLVYTLTDIHEYTATQSIATVARRTTYTFLRLHALEITAILMMALVIIAVFLISYCLLMRCTGINLSDVTADAANM